MMRAGLEQDKIKGQINAGKHRRDVLHLRQIFTRSAVMKGEVQVLTKERFPVVMEELGVPMDDGSTEDIFRSLDTNTDGVLDFDEFKHAVNTPSTIEQLISSLSISQLVADAIPKEKGKDEMRIFSRMSTEQMKEMCRVLMPFLENTLVEAAADLKKAFEKIDHAITAAQAASKYQVPPEMSAGKVDDFFDGLSARVGSFCVCNILFSFVAF